ncbi:MAG: hypothetical protein PHQ93_00580 [Sulfurimonas sp.]|uniref:hypothetical protein n=1 Tax=Sulfurimonas sp. TaxID=2022749 RepID=UPI002635A4C8|nr:hypothetical protein [Sulfurimonas sp.]MDD5399668.1 hypothetical protein [Sulfurimonas sp.]
MITSNKKLFFLLLFFAESLFGDIDYKFTNTNITVAGDSSLQNENRSYIYNYNRARFYVNYVNEGYFGSAIGDAVNYHGDSYTDSNSFNYLKTFRSDTPFKTQTNFKDYGEGAAYAKLYRLYGGYEDAKNRVVIGLQNISMGVGRIWTPTNIFNPKNIYAIEPDETFGVSALSYVRHLNDTSHITLVAAQNREHDFKYAGQYKGFLNFADIAINVVNSNNTKMVGYEIEGNLANTGIELRSEAGYIRSNLLHLDNRNYEEELFQGILGAEYGFKNGVTLVVETLYSSKKFSYNEVLFNLNSDILSNLVYSNFYTGATLSYSFNLFLDASLLYIESFDDKNLRFVSPSINYILSESNSFTLGAQMQNGKNNCFFKWSLSF